MSLSFPLINAYGNEESKTENPLKLSVSNSLAKQKFLDYCELSMFFQLIYSHVNKESTHRILINNTFLYQMGHLTSSEMVDLVLKPQLDLLARVQMYFPERNAQDLQRFKHILLSKFPNYQAIVLEQKSILTGFCISGG